MITKNHIIGIQGYPGYYWGSYLKKAYALNGFYYFVGQPFLNSSGEYYGNNGFYTNDFITYNQFPLGNVVNGAWYRYWTGGMCYGNGKWICGSSVGLKGGNLLAYSIDGINWSEVGGGIFGSVWNSVPGEFYAKGQIKGLAYGNGLYLGIGLSENSGGENRLIKSTDGINWDIVSIPYTGYLSDSWRTIKFLNGKFIIVGYRMIAYSTDGINWNKISFLGLNDWQDIAYGNGTYVLTSADTIHRLAISTDLINWNYKVTPIQEDFISIVFGQGFFILSNFSDGKIFKSTDGINWDLVQVIGNRLSPLSYGNGYFIGVNDFYNPTDTIYYGGPY